MTGSIADSVFARLAHRLDQVSIWSGRIAAWLLLPMVLSLCYEVVARYLFNAPSMKKLPYSMNVMS